MLVVHILIECLFLFLGLSSLILHSYVLCVLEYVRACVFVCVRVCVCVCVCVRVCGCVVASLLLASVGCWLGRLWSVGNSGD